MVKPLPSYFKSDKPVSVNVFGVIDDTLNKRPEVLSEIKNYLREKEEEIEIRERG